MSRQANTPDFDNMTDDEMIEFFALDDAIEDSKRYPTFCCDFCDKDNTLDNMTHVDGVKEYTSKTYTPELDICTSCFETSKTPCRFETGIVFIDSEDEREHSYTIEDEINHTPTNYDDSREFNLSRDKYGDE